MTNSTKAQAAESIETKPEASEEVPRWFSDGYTADTSEALMERYRERLAKDQEARRAEDAALQEYRRKLSEKFAEAERRIQEGLAPVPTAAQANREPIDPTPSKRQPRPTLPPAEIAAQPRRYMREANELRARKSMPYFAVAAWSAGAILCGASLGLAFANRDYVAHAFGTGWQSAKHQVAVLTRSTSNDTTTPSPVTFVRKPIASTEFVVADARGNLNDLIPLIVKATPGREATPVDFVISGLPQEAWLSAGKKSPEGKWLLKAPDLKDLKLVIPKSEQPKINLEVAAIEPASGQLAAPTQNLQVELQDVQITPVAGPPEQPETNIAQQKQPRSAVKPGEDAVAKGDELMKQGEILAARQAYLRGATMGNAAAMRGVGRSYDPKVFTELKIKGLKPDAAKAAEWYKKAAADPVQ